MAEKLKSILDQSLPILIVDDNVQYSQVLKKILQQGLGYLQVDMVESTERAFELISGEPQKFGLLFIDYNFPSGDTGGQLLLRLQQAGLLEDKVAFLITSDPTVDNLKQALNAGAMGVVAKPFDRLELKKQLEKAERSIQMGSGDAF